MDFLDDSSPALAADLQRLCARNTSKARETRSAHRGVLADAGIFQRRRSSMTVFLTLSCERRSYWWPLHPLGYALAGSWSTIEFWFPCLLAWMFKSLFLRYGGMSMYGKARPFFLGLILGEFGIAVFFVVINAVSHQISPEHTIPAPPFPWG